MFIQNNAEICVAPNFRKMIYTVVKDVIKIRNASELTIFRSRNSEVFSILEQSTNIILLKITLTYSAARSRFNYFFYTKVINNINSISKSC